MSVRAGRARVAGIVEGAVVEPEAVESSPETESLAVREETSVFEVAFPFFGRI